MPHTPQQAVFPPKPKRVYTPLSPVKPTRENLSPPIPEVEETTVVRPKRGPGRPPKASEE